MPEGSPVTKYHTQIRVPGFKQGDKALLAFNEAWGFVDGACNRIVGEEMVSLPYPEGFQESQTKLWRSYLVTLEVSVYKDGSRTFKVVDG